MRTLDERIARRLADPNYPRWRAEVFSVGGCSKPIRLRGSSKIVDTATKTVLHRRGGEVLTACGNRRETVCLSCSDTYAADAYHIVRAGLTGGAKNVPTTAAEHPRAFVTLTAPSFGPVHTQPTTTTGRRIPCRCGKNHPDADAKLGTPLNVGRYDYEHAVLWQAHAGKLWQRFVTRLRRELAKAAGIPVREFPDAARVSYGKVAEFQRRGAVHLHAVIRIDGPDGPADPPPAWASDELLDQAVRAAAVSAVVVTVRPDGSRLELRWGEQFDIRRIAASVDDANGEISDARLAAYIAKYSTKGTGASPGPERPIRSERHIDHLKISKHHKNIIRTAWALGGMAQYEGLNLRMWAHILGFRGHFLTKSRSYSTTFTAVRDERNTFRRAETLAQLGICDTENSVLVINDWRFTSAGWRDDTDRELAAAVASRIRGARRERYRKENTS